MEILLLAIGIIFLVLLNLAFHRPRFPFPPDEFYHPRERYFRDDTFFHPMHRSPFSEQLTAIINSVLFVLLLVAVIMYFDSTAH